MNFLYKTGGNPGFISPSGISIISPSVSVKTIIILMFWSNLINPLNNCCSWSTSGNFLHLWWWHVVSKTWLVQPRRSPHTSMITPGFTWTFPYLTTVPLHILVCFCGWDGIRMFPSRYIYFYKVLPKNAPQRGGKSNKIYMSPGWLVQILQKRMIHPSNLHLTSNMKVGGWGVSVGAPPPPPPSSTSPPNISHLNKWIPPCTSITQHLRSELERRPLEVCFWARFFSIQIYKYKYIYLNKSCHVYINYIYTFLPT